MTRPLDFSVIPVTLHADDVLEQRYAYSGANLEYKGYAKKPNAAASQPIWFIVKYHYTGAVLDRKQLPDNGPKFSYSWDDRITYFS